MVQPNYTLPVTKYNLLFPWILEPKSKLPLEITKHNIIYDLTKEDRLDEDIFTKSVRKNLSNLFSSGKSDLYDYYSDEDIGECISYLWVVLKTINSDSVDSKLKEIFSPDCIVIRFAKFYTKMIYAIGEKKDKEYRLVMSYIRNSNYPTNEELDSRSKEANFDMIPSNTLYDYVCYKLECEMELALYRFDSYLGNLCWKIVNMHNPINIAFGFYIMGKMLMGIESDKTYSSDKEEYISEKESGDGENNESESIESYLDNLCKKSLEILYTLEGLE